MSDNQSKAPSPLPSRRELIRQLHKISPDMSGAEIGRMLKCSRALVQNELGKGKLKRYNARDSIHINLGEELRNQLTEASADHDSVSGWCRDILSLACYLKSMGVDPVVVLGMKAKEVG